MQRIAFSCGGGRLATVRPARRPNETRLQEVARLLLKYFYRRVSKTRVNAWVSAHPEAAPHELINDFFAETHTFYFVEDAPFTMAIAMEQGLKPTVPTVTETSAEVIITLGSFVGIFIGSPVEAEYISAAQRGIALWRTGKTLVINVENNDGGSDKVMRKAVRGARRWARGVVRVSGQTASAAEMLAADLHYDVGFKLLFANGARCTRGALSYCKNMPLVGGFLGITSAHYTTPGGHYCARFYLGKRPTHRR